MAALKPKHYLVKQGDDTRIVRALTQQQAFNHVAEDTIKVALATSDDLVKALQEGSEVENAVQPEAA